MARATLASCAALPLLLSVCCLLLSAGLLFAPQGRLPGLPDGRIGAPEASARMPAG